MPVQMTVKAAPHGAAVKLWTDTARSEALEQLKNVARLPITYSHIAAMPDVHYGRGGDHRKRDRNAGGGSFPPRPGSTSGAACTRCDWTSRPASCRTTCGPCRMQSKRGYRSASRGGGADRRYRVPQGRRPDRRYPGRSQAD